MIGPPGCGKTSFVLRNAGIAADRFGPNAVMIASLTRTAAAEVSTRNQTGIPPESVATLHAHAYRALDRPALAETAEGFRAWNQRLTDRGFYAHWRIDPAQGARDIDYLPDERITPSSRGESYLATLNVLRARQAPRETWGILSEAERLYGLSDFAEEWDAFKKDSHRLDFTDLIERAIDEVEQPLNAPEVIFTDEAQDSSSLELALIRKWGETCEQIVIVGDAWQALFSFRGGDADAMFSGNAKSRIVLSQSYRVPAAVHRYAMQWIQKLPDYEPIEYAPRFNDPADNRSGTAEGSVEQCPHTWAHPEGLIQRILTDLEEGLSVAVLASCGYMLDPMIAILRQKGVPFHNPYRPNQGRWNPMRAAERLLSFLRPDKETWGDEARFWNWADAQKWMDPLRAKDLLERGAKSFVQSKAVPPRFGKESPTAPASVLASLFSNEVDADHAFALNVDWWEGSLLEKDKRVAKYPCTVYRERGGRGLRERPALVLGSIHSQKGSECDVAVVFPDLSQRAYVEAWQNPATRASTVKCFYVAFTRAREKLILCAPSGSFHVPFAPP